MQELGVMPSFRRPTVRDDDPYSEALFKALKSPQGSPDQPFQDLHEARTGVAGFVEGYNEVHHHSALRPVPPGQRHRGEDIALVAQRQDLDQETKANHPERWSALPEAGRPSRRAF